MTVAGELNTLLDYFASGPIARRRAQEMVEASPPWETAAQMVFSEGTVAGPRVARARYDVPMSRSKVAILILFDIK